MQTSNFFALQYVGVPDLMALQSVPQSGIRDILVSLVNKGVVSGITVLPTTPASLGVTVQTGKLILEDGSSVTTTVNQVLDLSPYINALSVGQTQYLAIWAIPSQTSDTPVVTPAGATINYRTYDSVSFVIVPGAIGGGESPVPPGGYTGVLIAQVATSAATSVTIGNIDQSVMQSFVSVPYILSLIAAAGVPPYAMSEVTGLVSALGVLTANMTAVNAALVADVGVINGTLATQEGQITTLNGQMTTANTNIAANVASINVLNTEVAVFPGEITTLNTNLATLTASFNTLNGAFGQNLARPGHKWIDGLLVQWGVSTSVSGRGEISAPLELAFPSTVIGAVATVVLDNQITDGNWEGMAFYVEPSTYTNVPKNKVDLQYDVRSDGSIETNFHAFVIAIGY